MKQFKEIIKESRLDKHLLLREASSLLKIDQALISKFERGERKPSKDQVILFAKIYEIDCAELLIAWHSDNIAYSLFTEKNVDKILRAAEDKVSNYKKNK